MLRTTLLALVAPLVFLAACGKAKQTAATIAEDSALAHDIAMAGRDSLAEPVMTDLSTGTPSADSVASAPEALPVSAAPPAPMTPQRVQASAPRSEIKTSPARVEEKKSPPRVSEAARTKATASRLAGTAPALSLATPTTDPATGREMPARPTTSAPPLPLPETPPPEAVEPEPDQPEVVAESEPDVRVRAGSAAAPPARTGGGRVLDPTSGEPSSGTIPAGVALALNSRSRICTNVHRVGQTFNATVARPVSGAGGAVIPAGATALVEITELRRGGTEGEPIRMGFHVSSVSFGGNSYPVTATATSAAIARIRKKSSSGQAEAISPASEADGCVPTGGRINARLNSSIRF